MEIVIIIGLILLNGLLSMSEIAMVSARKSRLEADSKKGSRAARTALKLANSPDTFLSTIQIGITLIGILTGLYSGEVLAQSFGKVIATIEPLRTHAVAIAQTLIVAIVTYLTLIVGELVPKRIGMQAAEKVAKLVARPMNVLSKIALPFVWLLSKSTSGMLRLLGINTLGESKVTEDEIKAIIQEGTVGGEIQEVEQDIVERVFNLGDRNVGSIMTHRSEIAWIDPAMTPAEIRELVGREPHTLYPAARSNLDRLAGVIYLKDLFTHIGEEDFDVASILRPAKFFHEETQVYTALEQLRSEQVGYGIVCDEFGVTQGIVTLHDIFEALVGSIPEEREEPDIVHREDGSCLIDGQCPFYDFLVCYGLEDVYPNNLYNTLSGLILDELGHIPQTGEKLRWNTFTFEIVDMDGARIDKILACETSEKTNQNP